MCGRCRQVFNAFQSLSRVEEPAELPLASLAEVLAEGTGSDASARSQQPPAAFFGADITPVPVADALFLREEPLPLPAEFTAPEPYARVPFSPVTTRTVRGERLAESPLLDPRLEKVMAVAHLQPSEVAMVEPAIDLSDEDQPQIVETMASGGTPAVANSRVWGVGVFVLFVGLSVQAAYAFRTAIVSNYPQMRPTVSQLCEFAGCSLSWGRDETALKIDASELIEAPGKPGRILLTAILVNRGKLKQDLPSLELRLTDNANQVVASRLLHPRDYLGRAIGKDEGLVPNIELYVNLNLDVSNKSQASGYGLIVFYP